MKKILILFFILFAFDSNAENTVVSLLKEEGKIVFIRPVSYTHLTLPTKRIV